MGRLNPISAGKIPPWRERGNISQSFGGKKVKRGREKRGTSRQKGRKGKRGKEKEREKIRSKRVR